MPFWQTNISWDGQKTFLILRNPKFHYRIHNSLPPFEPDDSIPRFYTINWRSIPTLFSHLYLIITSGRFPSSSPSTNPGRNPLPSFPP